MSLTSEISVQWRRFIRGRFVYKLFGIGYINRIKVSLNHKRILGISKKGNSLYLVPKPIAGGNVDHYYHFLFDLCVPIADLDKRLPKTVRFLIDEEGTFSPLLKRLFADRCHFFDPGSSKPLKEIHLLGINPKRVKASQKDFSTLRDKAFSSLGLSFDAEAHNVILIRRGLNETHIALKPALASSGKNRRAIINHDEVAERLSQIIEPTYPFRDVVLEEVDFEKQVDLFRQTRLLIGQHGAGLANMLWMPPDSTVIEIGIRRFWHFEALAKSLNLNYFRYETAGTHVEIDVDHFDEFVLNKIGIAFFSQ